MSHGTKKERSRSASKPESPPAWLVEEYERMKELAAAAEADRGQVNTYWHTSKARIALAIKENYGVEV